MRLAERAPMAAPRWLLVVGVSMCATALGADPTPAEQAEARCTRRLVQTLTGLELNQVSIGTPVMHPIQQHLAPYLAHPQFRRRLAAFINTKLSPGPSVTNFGGEDSLYAMATYVLDRDLPWREVFIGRYAISNPDSAAAQVTPDPKGLGIFRAPGWVTRYAGNAPDSYRLIGAYRMLQNLTGLVLVPSANNNQGDTTSKGRERADCRGCHFDSPWGLDKVARVIGKKVSFLRPDNQKEWHAGPPEEPQLIFGTLVHDDEELVRLIVGSNDFKFWTCRLAFEFVTGRQENTCEGEVFDRCMDAFEKDGSLISAVGAIAGSPEVCQ